MLETLKTRKEELEKRGKKGFTLMEMLIVIAIIAVLIAIAIPIFTVQLEKARESTDLANVRSAYAELVAGYLTDEIPDAAVEGSDPVTINVPVTQTQPGWQILGDDAETTDPAQIAVGYENGGIDVPAKTSGFYAVSIDDAGVVSVS